MPLFDRLKALIGRVPNAPPAAAPVPAKAPTAAVAPVGSGRAGANPGVIPAASGLYPPSDPGIPVIDNAELMAAQEALIRRTKVHSALAPSDFDGRFRQPIERLAAYVHTLPATSSGLFSGPGGLFRAAVETAFGAYQASDGRIFTGSLGVEERHKLEARWRYVCFLAGLFWPIGRTLEAVKVTAGDGKSWPIRVAPLATWASDNGIERFFCAWPREAFEPGPAVVASALIGQVVGEANMSYLEAGSPMMVSALFGIVTNTKDARYEIAHSVVRSMWERVVMTERARRPETYGRLQYGHHLAPQLVDLMCSLIAKDEWELNKSIVWVDSTGVYLQWPQASAGIRDEARAAGLEGLPATDTGLLAAMEDAQLIDIGPDQNPYVEIAIDDGEIVGAIKLVRPNVLIPEYDAAHYTTRTVLVSAIVGADPIAQAQQRLAAQAAPAATKPLPPPPLPQANLLQPTIGLAPPAPQAAPSPTATPAAPAPGPATAPDAVAKPAQSAAQPASQATGTQAKSAAAAGTPAKTVAPAVIGAPPPGHPPAALHPTPNRPVASVPGASKEGGERRPPPRPTSGLAPPVNARNASSSAPTEPAGSIKSVRYSGLVPPEVKGRLRGHDAEVLGRLIKDWQDSAPSETMQRVGEGSAFSTETLIGKVSDVPSFLQAMANAGLLHINKETPGRLLHEVTMAAGGEKKRCFVVAKLASQQLGLDKAKAQT